MALHGFLNDPSRNNHPAYNDSLFTTEAPEWSTGEVLLGSVYRKLLLGIHDNVVDLEEIVNLPLDFQAEREVWSMLLLERGGLASPLKSGQHGARPFRQLMPLVPHVAKHACVVGRLGKNRWFPGNLLLDILGAGAGATDSQAVLDDFAAALRVGDKDDIFGRFTEQRLATLDDSPGSTPVPVEDRHRRAYRGKEPTDGQLTPAERFCRDLRSVLELKEKLTRRQWTVLVEAVLRIGMGTHVLWACHVNARCWEMVLAIAGGAPPPTETAVEHALYEVHRDRNSFLEMGREAVVLVRRILERHLFGRYGLNLVLHKLDDVGHGWPAGQIIGFAPGTGKTAPKAVQEFLEHIAMHRTSIDADPAEWLRRNCRELCDSNLELVKSETGFTKNLLEFVRHTLGQIETDNPEQKSYDQSYLLANRQKGRGRASQWPVQPGPAMLILLVHACHKSQGDIPASLEDLRNHLADYGLRAPAGELAGGQVGADLEKLGLVVDSPDAAGGRLLVAPF
jgi:hypothetical protein